MVDLVLDTDRKQSVARDFDRGTVAIERIDHDRLCPGYLVAVARYRETPLLILGGAVVRADNRVDQRQGGAAIFTDVDHNDPLANIDLWRCQSDTGGLVQRLKHVDDQLEYSVINGCNLGRPFTKARIGKVKDIENGHRRCLNYLVP